MKKEKIYDDIQGVNKDPDANLMCEIEKILLARSENLEDFRRSLISQIGAFRLENVDQQVDYTLLFGNYLRRIKDNYYEKQKGICPVCTEHFEIDDMHGDHITPWHEGGQTISENCQMLCKEDNRRKSGK